MLSPLAQRLLQHIRKRDLMRPGDRVAIAVSGGADSVALLRLMLEIRTELGVVLSVAHFNHKIRAEASDADEGFVRDLAAQRSLDFHRGEADVPAHARERKLSLEAAAREVRYNFLTALKSVDKAATAHTIDDQAETVLMRLIRGSGPTGLAGIQERLPPFNTVGAKVIRPLLRTRRNELEEYLRALKQPWREDATNQDLHHTRNRVRQLVIPLLEREFNPAILERLGETAEIAQDEEFFWNQHLYGWSQGAIKDEEGWQGGVAFETSTLVRLPLAVQRRLARYVLHHLTISFQEVERILEVAQKGGTAELSGGWMVRRSGDRTYVHPTRELASSHYIEGVRVDRGTTMQIPELGISLVISRPALMTEKDCAPLNAIAPFILRPWRPGDRFWPQHSSGPKKVKELLTDRHISGLERQLWPVIACGDDIVWLRGFGVAEPYAVAEGMTHAIVVTEEPLDDSLA